MNLIQRIFRRETTKAPSASSAAITDRTVYVRGETLAMKLAAVYSAVDLLSSTVAKLPLRYLRHNDAQGIFVDNEESQLYYLLARRPSRRHTARRLPSWCSSHRTPAATTYFPTSTR